MLHLHLCILFHDFTICSFDLWLSVLTQRSYRLQIVDLTTTSSSCHYSYQVQVRGTNALRNRVPGRSQHSFSGVEILSKLCFFAALRMFTAYLISYSKANGTVDTNEAELSTSGMGAKKCVYFHFKISHFKHLIWFCLENNGMVHNCSNLLLIYLNNNFGNCCSKQKLPQRLKRVRAFSCFYTYLAVLSSSLRVH